MSETSARRLQPQVLVFAAALCAITTLQFEIVVIVASYVSRFIARSAAEPSLVVRLVLPQVSRLAVLPWEIAVLVIYGLLAVAYRRSRINDAAAIWAMWLSGTLVFYFLLWVAVLPFGTCC